MAQDWFIIRDGKETGPFTAQQLKQMVVSGKLQPDDKVRRSDMKTAIRAGSIKGLFASVEATATKSSPPPPTATAPPDAKKGVTTKKPLIIGAAIGGACLLLCCGGLGVIGTLLPKKQDTARKEAANKETGTGTPAPRPEEAKLIAEVEAQAPPLPEFPKSEYQYDYSKDDYTVPAGAKKETRKRVITSGADGLAGKPETTEGYLDSSGKWVEHGTFTTWTDDSQTKKLREGKLLRGKLHGVMILYYPNGEKHWEKWFVQDKMHGLERWWHENNQLASSSPWVQNKYHGRRQGWYENGSLAYDETYVHGDRQGVHKKWWKDGRLSSIACWRKNVKNGKVWSQNEDGSLGETGEWEDGRPKGKCRFAFIGPDKQPYYIEVSDDEWKGGTTAEFIARMSYFSMKDRPDLSFQFDPKLKIATYSSKADAEFFSRFGKPSQDVLDFEKAPAGAPAFLREQYRVWSYNCRDGVLTLHVQPTQTGSLMVTAKP